jgi:hypothetical protein
MKPSPQVYNGSSYYYCHLRCREMILLILVAGLLILYSQEHPSATTMGVVYAFSYQPLLTRQLLFKNNCNSVRLLRTVLQSSSTEANDGVMKTPANLTTTTTTTTTPRKMPLRPQEILDRQRARQKEEEDDDDEYPKLFDDNLLNYMQQMLLTLEKRVHEGPRSIGTLQVEEFMTMSQSITNDMKHSERQRQLLDPSTKSGGVIPATTTTTTTTSLPTQSAAVLHDTVSLATTSESQHEEDNEDGPKYDPTGGQGSLAKDTRNTYVIPDMDQMSPEEYQQALQKSLLEQQAERRKNVISAYGNRASWDYLNHLSGQSGQLKPPPTGRLEENGTKQ